MSKYPLHWCKEVAIDYKAHVGRGYQFLQQIYFLHDENVEKIIQKDQKLWNIFKSLVSKYDKLFRNDKVWENVLEQLRRYPNHFRGTVFKSGDFRRFSSLWYRSFANEAVSKYYDCFLF